MKQRFTHDDIPDQEGRIAIVTGSSSGIGYEAARVLALKNAKVIIAVRNPQKGDAALEKIKNEYPSADVSVMLIDLARLKSVKNFADEFNGKYDRLDLLINNAGVMVPPYSKTEEGFELQFGVNHLGHFALTTHLLGLLKSTENSRVVNVSSVASNRGNLNLEDLNWENRKYMKWNAYGDSKIANIHFTRELGKRFEKNGISTISAACHPGWTATDLQRHTGLVSFLNNFFSQGIDMGALPTLYAAIEPNIKNGDYVGPDGKREMKGYPKIVQPIPLAKDDSIAERLWDLSIKMTGVDPGI